jgi:hypothetical protein
MKTTNTMDSTTGFHVASIMAETGAALRKVLFTECGREIPRTEKPRTLTEMGQTIAAGKQGLAPLRIFHQHRGRKGGAAAAAAVYTLDGRVENWAGTDMASLKTAGEASLRAYIDSFYDTKPHHVTLRSQFKEKKKKQPKDANVKAVLSYSTDGSDDEGGESTDDEM